MRFVQFQRNNDDTVQRLGIVSEDGLHLTDLSANSCIANNMIGFLKQQMPMSELAEKIESLKNEPITDAIKLLPPVTNPEKIICIGFNYLDHCKELNKPVPTEPCIFSKYNNSLVGPRDDIIAHNITTKLDWEVELAVVIGKEAKSVSRDNAMDYVFGYTIAQDISARDWQMERNGGQYLIGKTMDTFCPLGPWLVHKSLIPDVNNLSMRTLINGVEKQCGNTHDLIFKIDDIIERLSCCITLAPGDIILTGTPKGVAMHRKPPEFLQPGDRVESQIQHLGKMLNCVVAP